MKKYPPKVERKGRKISYLPSERIYKRIFYLVEGGWWKNISLGYGEEI